MAPDAPAAAPTKRVPKPKFTFMLHDPESMAALGKFQSSDYRYAALKAASKGHKRILLRKTNTKEIREFEGSVVQLKEPKLIKRGDRSEPIAYSHRPVVSFKGKWTYAGAPDETSPIAAEQQPQDPQ